MFWLGFLSEHLDRDFSLNFYFCYFVIYKSYLQLQKLGYSALPFPLLNLSHRRCQIQLRQTLTTIIIII